MARTRKKTSGTVGGKLAMSSAVWFSPHFSCSAWDSLTVGNEPYNPKFIIVITFENVILAVNSHNFLETLLYISPYTSLEQANSLGMEHKSNYRSCVLANSMTVCRVHHCRFTHLPIWIWAVNLTWYLQLALLANLLSMQEILFGSFLTKASPNFVTACHQTLHKCLSA